MHLARPAERRSVPATCRTRCSEAAPGSARCRAHAVAAGRAPRRAAVLGLHSRYRSAHGGAMVPAAAPVAPSLVWDARLHGSCEAAHEIGDLPAEGFVLEFARQHADSMLRHQL